MKITENLLKKYARLIVRTGANVQPGQVVALHAAVEESAFALMLAEEAYQAGAKKVNIEWMCQAQNRLDFTYADTETLSRVLTWEEEKAKQMERMKVKQKNRGLDR